MQYTLTYYLATQLNVYVHIMIYHSTEKFCIITCDIGLIFTKGFKHWITRVELYINMEKNYLLCNDISKIKQIIKNDLFTKFLSLCKLI